MGVLTSRGLVAAAIIAVAWSAKAEDLTPETGEGMVDSLDVTTISPDDVGAYGAAIGEIWQYNGTQWVPATDGGGGGVRGMSNVFSSYDTDTLCFFGDPNLIPGHSEGGTEQWGERGGLLGHTLHRGWAGGKWNKAKLWPIFRPHGFDDRDTIQVHFAVATWTDSTGAEARGYTNPIYQIWAKYFDIGDEVDMDDGTPLPDATYAADTLDFVSAADVTGAVRDTFSGKLVLTPGATDQILAVGFNKLGRNDPSFYGSTILLGAEIWIWR